MIVVRPFADTDAPAVARLLRDRGEWSTDAANTIARALYVRSARRLGCFRHRGDAAGQVGTASAGTVSAGTGAGSAGWWRDLASGWAAMAAKRSVASVRRFHSRTAIPIRTALCPAPAEALVAGGGEGSDGAGYAGTSPRHGQNSALLFRAGTLWRAGAPLAVRSVF